MCVYVCDVCVCTNRITFFNVMDIFLDQYVSIFLIFNGFIVFLYLTLQ